MISKILENFRNELKEAFYKGLKKSEDYQEIFKNPSAKELKNMANETSDIIRGVLLKEGDLYIINGDDYTHFDLLKELGNIAFDGSKKRDSINISSLKEKPREFFLSEGYDDDKIKLYKKSLNEYVKIIKKKNPILSLTIKNIWN